MQKGVDCMTPCDASTIASLQSQAIAFVGRYYSSTDQSKVLTATEATALSSAGILIAALYEDDGTDPTTFSSQTGTANAQTALQQAAAAGQPKGSAIYFSVDFDAQPDQLPFITRYFQSVKAVFTGTGYDVGVYGSGSVCARMLRAGLATYAWLAESTGWTDSQTFSDWSILQSVSTNPQFDNDVARETCGLFTTTA